MFDHVVERKSPLLRLSDKMIRQLSQMALAFPPVSRLVWAGGDKSADAATSFNHAAALQLRVNPGHGIRIDAQIHGQLAHRRQLIADTQFSGSYRKPNRSLELVIKWRWMFGIDLKHH